MKVREGAFKYVHSNPERVELYLFEEVFESLDKPTRQFLLNVSILQRMNGQLCKVVAGEHGARMLAELEKRNMFLIPLDEDRDWYRFHHVFGEFLLKRRDAWIRLRRMCSSNRPRPGVNPRDCSKKR